MEGVRDRAAPLGYRDRHNALKPFPPRFQPRGATKTLHRLRDTDPPPKVRQRGWNRAGIECRRPFASPTARRTPSAGRCTGISARPPRRQAARSGTTPGTPSPSRRGRGSGRRRPTRRPPSPPGPPRGWAARPGRGRMRRQALPRQGRPRRGRGRGPAALPPPRDPCVSPVRHPSYPHPSVRHPSKYGIRRTSFHHRASSRSPLALQPYPHRFTIIFTQIYTDLHRFTGHVRIFLKE